MPGREEALERSKLAQQKRSLEQLQGQFTDAWFPGGEAFSEPIIRVHDAAHQWSNISPSARGELQQNVVDLAGSLKLYEKTGARGLVNSLPFKPGMFDADDLDEDAVGEALSQLHRGSQQIEHPIRGLASQSELPPNDPARLQVPPLTSSEIKELAKRGQEFYGRVGDALNRRFPGLKGAQDPDAIAKFEAFSPAPGLEVELPVNPAAAALHSKEGAGLSVEGGYDGPGRMSYGPMEARMNRPLHYTVDEGLLMREAGKDLRKEIEGVMAMPGVANAAPGTRQQAEARVRWEESARLGLPSYGVDPEQPSGLAKTQAWLDDHDRTLRDAVNYNLGKEASALEYVMRAPKDRQLVDIAARARNLGKVKGAIRAGFNATTDVAGSLPLFDSQFRQAVETGNLRKAGEQVAKEYIAGTLAAPVVGTGTGVLQRVAPQAAARALPAVAAAVRVGNPLAVVSQLGGDSNQTPRQRAEQRRRDPGASGAMGPSADPQLLRAEAARRRGGRWKVGPFTVPDLGISEAGGLFFRFFR